MKNHYKILEISRNASSKSIKNKAKELLKQIKESNLESKKKIVLAKKVIESYEFLTDYHMRRKLDNYLDNQYNIIDNNNTLINTKNSFPFISVFSSNFDDLFNFPTEFEVSENNDNQKNYYYSKSSVTRSELDKDGNIISKTKEVTNNNGNKKENEYTKKVNKKDIKPITYII